MAQRGTVDEFASDGWGVLRAEGGGHHPFHCTAIVDGSRQIDVGRRVTFRLVPGRQGRWEAADVTPVSGP